MDVKEAVNTAKAYVAELFANEGLSNLGLEEVEFDYRLEHHPEFVRRVAVAREALKEGRGVRLEDLPA